MCITCAFPVLFSEWNCIENSSKSFLKETMQKYWNSQEWNSQPASNPPACLELSLSNFESFAPFVLNSSSRFPTRAWHEWRLAFCRRAVFEQRSSHDRGLILPMFLEHTIFQHFFEWTAPSYTGILPSHVTEWFLQDRRVQNLIRPGPEQRGATDIVIQWYSWCVWQCSHDERSLRNSTSTDNRMIIGACFEEFDFVSGWFQVKSYVFSASKGPSCNCLRTLCSLWM